MDLSQATPVEIDTIIADLAMQAWKQADRIDRALASLHHAVGDRQISRTAWRMSDDEVIRKVQNLLEHDDRPDFIKFHGSTQEKVTKSLKTIEEAQAERARLFDEIRIHEDEYRRRPWSRFFMLRRTVNAHIHSHSGCQGLHSSDLSDLGWHPELSGKSEKEAVDELGPVMCSKCFPSAPVEWRRNPKDLVNNPNTCPGGDESPAEGTIERSRNWAGVRYYGDCPRCGQNKLLKNNMRIPRHDKPKGKANEITAPDGSPLKVGSDTIRTVRTAEINYTDDAAYVEACRKGYPATGRLDEAYAHAELILQALAAKNGTSVEAERERLALRVAKKARQYDV